MDHTTGRRTWRTLEPYHAAIYFAPEAPAAYAELGVTDAMSGYFASRAAPMGAVGAEVVAATFFNFDHGFVRRCMDGVWDAASPAQMVQARLDAADRILTRHVVSAPGADRIPRAAELARIAAEDACERLDGRPLFAGLTSLEWPDEPHLVLWHAQTLLREFRGDGHIIALADAEVDGCESLVTHGASGDVPSRVLKSSRRRTDADWDAAVARLQERGWLTTQATFTDVGRAARTAIEDATDRLAFAPYATLGEERCAELRQIVRPWSAALAETFPR